MGGDSEQLQTLSAKDSKSKLPKAVQVTQNPLFKIDFEITQFAAGAGDSGV